MISFCCSLASKPLFCTTSRFCHKLSERALFLSCSCNAGGDMTPDSATTVPAVTSGERLSRCRRCSISCCLEVSRYSWYKKAEGSKENEPGIRYIWNFSLLFAKALVSTVTSTQRSCHTSGLASVPLVYLFFNVLSTQEVGMCCVE